MGVRGDHPKSQRQKRILDVAEENPEASIETIASKVPTASPDTVEQVLDTYGDPADSAPEAGDNHTEGGDPGNTDTTSANTGPAESTSSATGGIMNSATDSSDPEDPTQNNADSGYPSFEELSNKQQEVIEAVAADPAATQREIGERLDISGATVSNRASNIPEFDWSDRETFVEEIMDEASVKGPAADGGKGSETTATEATPDPEPVESTSNNRSHSDTSLEELQDEIRQLQTTVSELEDRDDSDSSGTISFADPELIHKVVRACLNADAISEEEELQIIDKLLN